ncbi:Rgp1-domain-containing protein [Lentinula aff. lateritia]|uniref:Rgp1-domain-containing protein n=1 Tax=Lentinula aff. lateritia TaxID=2804960 RepID=A0ACC1TSB9_9AGAR|nr:Rgp1-domain-containing protein [Lentinula aff. lateritia]
MSFPLISDAAGDPDSPIRAVVTPSQSAYFAGETLSVTITFTNTRTYSPEGEAGPSSRTGAVPRSSRTHKRASHSVSSAPIARPPTSSAGLYRPRTPTTAAVPGSPAASRQTSLGLETGTRIKRRGLIGNRLGAEWKDKTVPDLAEQRRTKISSKSLSLNLGFCQDETELATGLNDNEELAKSSSQMQRSLTADAHLLLSSPKIPSPLTRSETLPLSSKHPHARKQSLMDGTQLPYSPPTANTLVSAPASTGPSTPSASTSSFSLALDPISETSPVVPAHPYLSPSVPATASASGLGPALSSPSISVEAPSPPSASIRQHSYPPFSSSKPTSTRQLHRPPNLGIGKPSSRMFLNLSETNAELILYSYAQLKGTVTLTPIPSNTVPAQTLAALRQALLKGSAIAVGGGSMDITSRTHSRTPSLSGTAKGPSSPTSASARRVVPVSSVWPSVASSSNQQASVSAGLDQPASFTSVSALSSPGLSPGLGSRLGLGLGWSLGLGQATEEVDPELPLPTFEAQSTMLAVDVCLEPGESKSYQYSILLPANLPPTFRGRTLRFAYELVVGICRAGPSNNFVPSEKGSGPGGSVSKVMKVPIRVYTNVVVGRPPTPYDLLWPVNKRRSTLVLGHRRGGRLSSSAKESRLFIDSYSSLSGSAQASGSLNELKEYAKRLVAELPQPSQLDFELQSPPEPPDVSTNGHGNGHTENPVHVLAFKEKERIAKMRQREESDDPIPVGGCGEAVEILTRNPKKVSYDVNKDGVKVAVLTFIKSAFRLGETIHGVVELNERQGRARVVQLSAHLETHESLPYPISTTPNTAAATRQLKRVHVEHHSSFVLSTLRTTFALDIPSDASPAFQIRVGDQPFHTDAMTHPKSKFNGGLEWKVRLCLLVAVAKENSDSGTESVRFKSLVRDGPRGEWGSAWKAPIGAAPCEKPMSTGSSTAQLSPRQQQQPGVVKSWTSFIAASFLGAAEGGYHDGDEFSDYSSDPNDDEVGYEGNHTSYDGIKPNHAGGVGTGVNFGGGREVSWQEIELETVECEVPVSVWPGNTAFKPVDVVFDV